MASGDNAALLAYAGRYSVPEYIGTITHTSGIGARYQLQQTINMTRPLNAFVFEWTGRVVVAVANYAAAAAESPMTILNRITIQGVYKKSQQTPIDVSGATMFTWSQLFGTSRSQCFINGTLQNPLGIPNAQALATFGNIGTYDVRIVYHVPVYPMVTPGTRAAACFPWYWQGQDWTNLNVFLQLGDSTSFGTLAGTTTCTFTAIGSASGNPQVNVYGCYAQMGSLWDKFQTQLLIRSEQPSLPITALQQNYLLATLNHLITTNVMVKTGLNLTGTNAFANVFASLSDTILDLTQVQVDNRAMTNNLNNLVQKSYGAALYGTTWPQGYLVFPFIASQQPRTAFRADPAAGVLPQTSAFNLMSTVASANANNLCNIIQESILYENGNPYWTVGGMR